MFCLEQSLPAAAYQVPVDKFCFKWLSYPKILSNLHMIVKKLRLAVSRYFITILWTGKDGDNKYKLLPLKSMPLENYLCV